MQGLQGEGHWPAEVKDVLLAEEAVTVFVEQIEAEFEFFFR